MTPTHWPFPVPVPPDINQTSRTPPVPLLVKSGGHHWIPVQTFSLQDPHLSTSVDIWWPLKQVLSSARVWYASYCNSFLCLLALKRRLDLIFYFPPFLLKSKWILDKIQGPITFVNTPVRSVPILDGSKNMYTKICVHTIRPEPFSALKVGQWSRKQMLLNAKFHVWCFEWIR